MHGEPADKGHCREPLLAGTRRTGDKREQADMAVGSVPGQGDAVANAVLAGQLHHLPALLITTRLIVHHIGPQNGGAPGHGAFDDGVDGKEATAGIGIHPGLRTAVEDDDVRALDGTGKDQGQAKIVESHAFAQFAQQGHYGALVSRRLELADKLQRVQGIHFRGMRIMHKIRWPNMETC